jgi:hypothetical protein
VLFLFVFPVTYADSGVTWPQLNPATGTGFSGTALRTAIHSPGDDSRDDGRAKNNESAAANRIRRNTGQSSPPTPDVAPLRRIQQRQSI